MEGESTASAMPISSQLVSKPAPPVLHYTPGRGIAHLSGQHRQIAGLLPDWRQIED